MRAYNYDNLKPIHEWLDQLPSPRTLDAEIPGGDNVIATLLRSTIHAAASTPPGAFLCRLNTRPT